MFINSKNAITDRCEFLKKFGHSQNVANTTTKWHPSDTKELFDANLKSKERRHLLNKLGWTDSNVEYRFNNYGFRTDDDFDLKNPEPGIITVGCSFTEGIGINLEDMWGYKVCQKLGYRFYNLGQGGTGIETQYRLLKAWAPILKPVAILSQGSWTHRYEFIIDNKPFSLIPQSDYFTHPSHEEFYNTVLASDAQSELMITKTYDAIANVVASLNIPFYELNENSLWDTFPDFSNDFARDLMHPGRLYNSAVANYFYRFF